ncbi:endo-b1,4-mannanase 5C [Klebsiella pneumoniae]|uniref:Endo-b1,4-mannanase 5C n=1 Tax=Klebsiella pneumoniae TaxID=573 RepID=A0A377U325_KLEPN|nr:endo-b1,4-mannanase 5C [Klebsiella pneumoniae]
MPIGLKPGAWFTAPGTYALTFTADDGLLKSSKTVTVTWARRRGKRQRIFVVITAKFMAWLRGG